jgi:hypothetical protein
MQLQQALYDYAVSTGTFSQYVNSLLFTVAVIMANSSDDAKMLGYITSKAQEIRASKKSTQET